jgi:hypothetical protein
VNRRQAEIAATIIVAVTGLMAWALPQSSKQPAANLPPVHLPTVQTTLPQEFEAPAKCNRGKSITTWGARVVPADTECLETAKEVGIVWNGPMHFEKTTPSFENAVKEAGTRKVRFFRITSPGGDVRAGLGMGLWLKQHKDVQIEIPKWCASACSLAVLTAGPNRIKLSPGGEIVLHQTYDRTSGDPDPTYNASIAAILRKSGVPETTVRGFARTPPSDGYVMTPAELAAYGVKTA